MGREAGRKSCLRERGRKERGKEGGRDGERGEQMRVNKR